MAFLLFLPTTHLPRRRSPASQLTGLSPILRSPRAVLMVQLKTKPLTAPLIAQTELSLAFFLPTKLQNCTSFPPERVCTAILNQHSTFPALPWRSYCQMPFTPGRCARRRSGAPTLTSRTRAIPGSGCWRGCSAGLRSLGMLLLPLSGETTEQAEPRLLLRLKLRLPLV